MGPDVFRALEKQSGFRLTIWTRRQCLSLGYSCTTQSTGFDSSEKVHEGGDRMLVSQSVLSCMTAFKSGKPSTSRATGADVSVRMAPAATSGAMRL